MTAAILLVAAATLPFLTNLHGAFVYDDLRQIVGNPSIKDPGALGQALLSDVWAFKGDREESWSNYWRPLFVLWLAGLYRAAGLASTVPWHLASVSLHALATLLAWRVARRLGVAPGAALAVGLIFAVHPTRVESVAWISGAPDLLAAIPLLGAVLAAHAAAGNHLAVRRRGLWLLVGALFGLSLLAKEIGILFPFLAAMIAAHGASLRRTPAFRSAAAVLLGTGAVAAAYLIAREAVLGYRSVDVPWRLSGLERLLNVPQLLAFYLRQALLPLRLGPSYPLRPLAAGELDVAAFWLPLAISAAAAALGWRLVARGGLSSRAGAALFLLPLLPAFYIDAFPPEQIVHDRYLYLPLLGLLLVVVPACAGLLGISAGKPGAAVPLAVGVAVLLASQSARYSRDWGSELTLWSRAVAVDPDSAFHQTQLAHALLAAGRDVEARDAAERAVAVAPAAAALLARAEVALAQGRHADAERDLRRIAASPAGGPETWMRLALSLQGQGRLGEAEAVLREGRRRAPWRACAYGTNLAVVLRATGRPAEALAELEAARRLVSREPGFACRRSLGLLGALYEELGRPDDAREAFRELLALPAGEPPDPALLVLQRQATAWLGQLSRDGR